MLNPIISSVIMILLKGIDLTLMAHTKAMNHELARDISFTQTTILLNALLSCQYYKCEV